MIRFLEVLQAHQVTGVLDIRDPTLFLREEYNPQQLAELCHRIETEYYRVPPLEIPQALLHRPRTNGSSRAFMAEYEAYLAGIEGEDKAALTALAQREGTWLLLCVEESPEICHRGAAAVYLASLAGLPPSEVIEVALEEQR